MSISVNIPNRRSSLVKHNLIILSSGIDTLGPTSPSQIVVRLDKGKFVGHWEDEASRITVFVSGCLAHVPAPFRPGTGAAAAQVLGSLYLSQSTAVFAAVDGAFCAVVFDWDKKAIFIGRDKLGIGGAYLYTNGDAVAFSDTLSDILDTGIARHGIDVSSIYAFLTIGWIPSPHSMFSDVAKLRPGSILEFRDGQLNFRTYYDVPHSLAAVRKRPLRELGEQVAHHLDESVDRGLALGGRWGSFLSGGVDSSSVVSSLARTPQRVFPTYFGGFTDKLNRYLPNPEDPEMSRLVAAHFGTDHRMLWLGAEVVNSAPEIISILEEPVCDGGSIILGAIMKSARHEIDGLMTGIGGDFLFTGERRHMVLNLLRYMGVVPDAVWNGLAWLSGKEPIARNARISQMHFDLQRLLAVKDLGIEAMYAGFFRQADITDLQSLFLPQTLSLVARDPLAEINEYFLASEELDPLARFLYLDLKTQMTDHCVREAEILGRHFGLSIYSPFLDSEFVDFAMSIPSSAKVSGLRLKVPLRAAMRGRVPDRVLDRKKGGLASPIRWWVTEPNGLVSKILSPDNIDRRGLFSADAVEAFRRKTVDGVRDYSSLLWGLFTLEIWFQRFVDGRPFKHDT